MSHSGSNPETQFAIYTLELESRIGSARYPQHPCRRDKLDAILSLGVITRHTIRGWGWRAKGCVPPRRVQGARRGLINIRACAGVPCTAELRVSSEGDVGHLGSVNFLEWTRRAVSCRRTEQKNKQTNKKRERQKTKKKENFVA
jgi:hypothetical protein